jgi:hypothetical protein
MADLIKTFSETGTWVAKNAAEEFLQLAGFSVGAKQFFIVDGGSQ